MIKSLLLRTKSVVTLFAIIVGNESMEQRKKTFAFISYSRVDKEIAIDLLKTIETYAYPKEWVVEENRPDDAKFVRPIFIDQADLSVRTRNFTDEIRERLSDSRYLIVLCTEHSAKSEFVKREINYFLSTHKDNPDLICAVYVDKIFNGMHPVIDEIVASRNCPIYVTSEGDAGHTGRKYCLHHILEFLLKVEFAKLYNRYEEYSKRKKVRRMQMAAVVLALAFSLLTWGLVSETRRARIEHARVEFEMGVFPYSLVVGYIDNFLHPTLKQLSDSCAQRPHIIIIMPYSALELSHRIRTKKYDEFINHHYEFIGYKIETIRIPNRHRESSVSRVQIAGCNTPIYIDDVRTVSAFRSVIRYKLSSRNPVPVPKAIRERFTQQYTDSFIVFAQRELGRRNQQVHFVRNTTEMGHILDSLINLR